MTKKKILYLSQSFPLPPDAGGRIKTFNTIMTLSKKFDVFAVFISDREAMQNDLIKFKKAKIACKIFTTDLMIRSIKDDYLKLAWNYLQLRPHCVYQYRYLPGIKWVKEKIKNWQPDVIHVDHVNSAQFLPSRKWLTQNCLRMPKLILENHNLDHILFFTRLKETKKIARKIYLFLEGSLNWLYGEINYRRFDHIFTISDTETTYLSKKNHSVSTQPLVYPLKKISSKKEKKYDILFIGYLSWPPNEVAVNWFSKEIMPLINKQMPEVEFHVVGKENINLNNLKKNKRIIFHGYQQSIDKFLSKSKVFVLPFQTGAGVRIKSLTALQNNIPLVSTNIGIDGLHLTNGQEYLKAETAKEFAEQTISLLKNKQLRDKMSKKQNKYFIRNHGLKINSTYLTKYQKISEDFNQPIQ